MLRSLLNADVIGFHTFDYARHFLSCCSRMLGLEHRTSRGAIIIEYYGRDVGIKVRFYYEGNNIIYFDDSAMNSYNMLFHPANICKILFILQVDYANWS